MKSIIAMLFLFIITGLFSLIIEVDINGSTPFQLIQSGIDVSVDGDTVLVHPGTYTENIIIENKSIVLTSFEMITGDSIYIENTIIDGNQNGSCVYADNVENGTLRGFTIQNGSGTENNYVLGGGIFISNSVMDILFCNIINNTADIGGGCLLYYSTVNLSDNKIVNNHAILIGGGLCIGVEAFITFDNDNLNSIYLNTGGRANDIWLSSNVDIILDKFTVNNPDYEFIGSYEASYTFSCQQAVIEQIQNDLYVNPNGSNGNSGLTPNNPLKTIAYANLLVKADSLNPRSIYVADGLYSTNSTGENLPINLKSYVSIIGESEENTIIDGDEYYPIMTGMDGEREVVIKNFTFQNSQLKSHHRAPLRFCYTTIDSIWHRFTVDLENITIKNATPRTSDDAPNAISFIDGDSIIMKNITIEDNICGRTASFWTTNLEAENLIIRNNQYLSGSEHCYGWALTIVRHNTFFPNDNPVILKNLLLNNNAGIGDLFFPPLCFFVAAGAEAYVINGTFADNAIYGGNSGIIRVDDESQLTLVNSVVHNNEGLPVYLDGDEAELTVDHCLLTNGIDDIYTVGDPTINWLEGNLSGNPEFQGEGAEYPYNYLSTSPCIDNGTNILPDGIEFPEYDLAGNQRIYGATIDMGAFEWQGVNFIDNEIDITKFTLSNYPNPFNPTTTISFSLPEDGDVELSIYNVKGQKVKQLVNDQLSAGQHSIEWNGKDANNKSVSSGIYFYKISTGNSSAMKKMLLLK